MSVIVILLKINGVIIFECLFCFISSTSEELSHYHRVRAAPVEDIGTKTDRKQIHGVRGGLFNNIFSGGRDRQIIDRNFRAGTVHNLCSME